MATETTLREAEKILAAKRKRESEEEAAAQAVHAEELRKAREIKITQTRRFHSARTEEAEQVRDSCSAALKAIALISDDAWARCCDTGMRGHLPTPVLLPEMLQRAAKDAEQHIARLKAEHEEFEARVLTGARI